MQLTFFFFVSLLLALFLPSRCQSDAVSLMAFKLTADLDNVLSYKLKRNDSCSWQGVKCGEGGRIVRLFIPSSNLRGIFANNTLSNLAKLRVLNLANNSISGAIPDLSRLIYLKSLILSGNNFSYLFPPSIVTLQRLSVLDLSSNNLSGPLPSSLANLDRLSSLFLEDNHFEGGIPPLNQSLLVEFNVSSNQLSGPIPITPALSRFSASSFLGNLGLCGQILNRVCSQQPPFFNAGRNSTQPKEKGIVSGGENVVVVESPDGFLHRRWASRNAPGLIAAIAVSIIVITLMAIFLAYMLLRMKKKPSKAEAMEPRVSDEPLTAEKNPGETLNGRLVFSEKEQTFTMEELMRASAELLGRGTLATTYKATVNGGKTVTVKRLDSAKTRGPIESDFEAHMKSISKLRHFNLVPLLAYFQADNERLIVYRYHPNGSLFNLIHGSTSARAKPLHWTSCLKIAEDVAQALAYIHVECQLAHGNLKSSNVLLGSDFEACVTDYCLSEGDEQGRRMDWRADVYEYGVVVMEVISGKHRSDQRTLAVGDAVEWVRSVRGDGGDDCRQLAMLTEIATVCRSTSPDRRPSMVHVVKMIQEIKESVLESGNLTPLI